MKSSLPTALILTLDAPFGRSLTQALTPNGFKVRVVAQLQEALEAVKTVDQTLLIVDRRALSIRQVRQTASFSRVNCLTILPVGIECSEDACVQDLEEGADAALCGKTNRQVVALVRALVRRSRSDYKRTFVVGDVEMDLDRYEVRIKGQPIEMTRKQYQILEMLFLHSNRVVTKEQIISNIWGENFATDEHTITVHIHAIRRKIERDANQPELLQTVRGIGYRLKR